jgi:hypothetical protein
MTLQLQRTTRADERTLPRCPGKVLGRFEPIEGKIWSNPVLAHGKLYVRNARGMACCDLAEPSR